jgi:hypothetical protein
MIEICLISAGEREKRIFCDGTIFVKSRLSLEAKQDVDRQGQLVNSAVAAKLNPSFR